MGTELKYERHDQVEVITINRPDKGNAMTIPLLYELEGHIRELAEDRELRALILTGTGSKFFCSGLDIDVLSWVDDQVAYWELSRHQKVITSLEEFHRPVIAAINGFCIGGGLGIALGCDIRLASENAKFASPETRMGLCPDWGGSQRLTRLVGPGQAKRIILSGMTVSVEEAARIGLVEQVVPADKLLEESMSLARKIAGNAPIGVRLAKRAINMAMDVSLYAGLQFEQAAATYCLKSQDKNEAVSSFMEKRSPQFNEK